MKLIWLAVAELFLFSALAWAAPLQDYSIGYTIKNPDGTISSFIKYYLRDGNKFRAEYLNKDGVAHTVNILRKDKGLVWSLDPNLKTYFEVPLRQDKWENAVMGVSATISPELKKTGTTKFLNYPCDIYEVESDEWINIDVIELSMNIFFRFEIK
jgi:outer membrane lipoprotein-sorting protein